MIRSRRYSCHYCATCRAPITSNLLMLMLSPQLCCLLQVGAVIVDDSNVILSIGYNGFPRGVHDGRLPWAKRSSSGSVLDTKYPYVRRAFNANLYDTPRPLLGTIQAGTHIINTCVPTFNAPWARCTTCPAQHGNTPPACTAAAAATDSVGCACGGQCLAEQE